MPRDPVFQVHFIACKQGFEAVEQGVHLLNDQPAAVEFGVQGRVVVGLPIRCPLVAGNVSRDAAVGSRTSQFVRIEGLVGVEKQAAQTQAGLCEQVAEFGRHAHETKCIVMVARLGYTTP